MSKAKRLARQISEQYELTPKDLDPEEDVFEPSEEDQDSEESADELAGTEHYVPVEKGKISRPEISLGIEYSGAKVRRHTLEEFSDDVIGTETSSEDSETDTSEAFVDPENFEPVSDDEDRDIDSDQALGDSDDEKFKNFKFRGSSKPRKIVKVNHSKTENYLSESETNEEDGGVSMIDKNIKKSSNCTFSADEGAKSASDDDTEVSESSSCSNSDRSENGDDIAATRSELQNIMAEDQKLVVSNLTEAVKADARKGQAVMVQRKAFDSLLNVRMTLQKALIASNTLTIIEEKDRSGVENEPYEAAEEAAIKLWNTLDSLRQEISKSLSTQTGQKRKREAHLLTPSSHLWERMQKYEVAFMNNRQTTLEKWSAKARGSAVMPISQKFNPVASQQSITSVIQDKLADPEHLIRRTKMPRSCAPIQRDNKVVEDPNIYDDGIFYQMLLKDLVDQRRVMSLNMPAIIANVNTAPWATIKEARTKKVVDTRASKGRKMRYTVHEKLQNFMAPEDRSSWEPAAVDRLFSTLLGQKFFLGEDLKESDDEMDTVDKEDELRLF